MLVQRRNEMYFTQHHHYCFSRRTLNLFYINAILEFWFLLFRNEIEQSLFYKKKILKKIINYKNGDVYASSITCTNFTIRLVRETFSLLEHVGFGCFVINNRGAKKVHKFHKVPAIYLNENIYLQNEIRSIGLMPQDVHKTFINYPN